MRDKPLFKVQRFPAMNRVTEVRYRLSSVRHEDKADHLRGPGSCRYASQGPPGSFSRLPAALVVFLLFAGLFPTVAGGQSVEVTRVHSSKITDLGLYFEGAKGTTYQFGKRISPHGDCIDVTNGYVFVTWYRGGMDDRTMMLSRKELGPTGTWKTIEFPHRHMGFRGDGHLPFEDRRGDSHNTIAVAVSPIDDTVHLIYDMHAYSTSDDEPWRSNYFNYSVSMANAAFVPDAEWTIGLFGPKRGHLRSGEDYQRLTYPNFARLDDGSLVVRWRKGGSGNGDDYHSRYDGTWSAPAIFSDGTLPGTTEDNNIYAGVAFQHGKLIRCFPVRYAVRGDGELSNGLHYAEATTPYAADDWRDIHGNPLTLPIADLNEVLVTQPLEWGYGKNMNGITFTTTANGAFHYKVEVGGTMVHYYRPPGASGFVLDDQNIPGGGLGSLGGYVLAMDQNGSGRPRIWATAEGTSDWQIVHDETSGPGMRHYNTRLNGDGTLVYYLMEPGSGQAQPLHVYEYAITTPPVEPTYTLTVNNGSGSGSYVEGAVVDIAAGTPPATDQQFDRWTGDTTHLSNPADPRPSIVMTAADVTVTATYRTVPTRVLTVGQGEGGGAYAPGYPVAIAADPAPAGSVFDRWLGDTAYLGDIHDPTTTVTMPDEDLAVAASYQVVTSFTFSPTEDAYLQGGVRYNNSDLKVEPGHRISYLKFDLSGLNGAVDNATIVLQESSDPGEGTLRFFAGSHHNWTETELSSANAPSIGSQVGVWTGSVGNEDSIAVDVSPLVQGNGEYTLIIQMDGGGNDIWFSSKEGSTAPQLVVETSGPPSEPQAVIGASPQSGGTPLLVQFDGSGSQASSGATIIGYEWDFDDDGTTDALGANASHTYASPGSHTARLTVTDSLSLSSSVTVAIEATAGSSTIVTTTVARSGVSGVVQQDDTGNFGGASWHVKNASQAALTRKAYLRFDLGAPAGPVEGAHLDLVVHLIDESIGDTDQVLNVYGLTDESMDQWDPATTTWSVAPGNDTASKFAADPARTDFLGTIELDFNGDKAAPVGSTVTFDTGALTAFLGADTNGLVTLIIGRTANPKSSVNLLFKGDSSASPPSLTITRSEPGNNFDAWIGAYPGLAGLTGLDDDPDGDLLPNGIENFFGTHPGEFSQGLTAGISGSGQFTITHPQGPLADDLTATYRWSTDLVTFHGNAETNPAGTTCTFSTLPDTPSAGWTTVVATLSGNPVEALFVVVEVTR
jgi:PKD repeat protein